MDPHIDLCLYIVSRPNAFLGTCLCFPYVAGSTRSTVTVVFIAITVSLVVTTPPKQRSWCLLKAPFLHASTHSPKPSSRNTNRGPLPSARLRLMTGKEGPKRHRSTKLQTKAQHSHWTGAISNECRCKNTCMEDAKISWALVLDGFGQRPRDACLLRSHFGASG